MQNVIEELKRIQAAVTNLIEVLESSPENKTVSATVGEIRSVAILEEIYRCSGSVTPEQISEFAVKYGKTPSSCAGYYSGKKPSLNASDDRKRRLLTKQGEETVLAARHRWGDDWLDRVPQSIIANDATSYKMVIDV